MGDTNAPKTEELAYGMRPRYLRHNVWDPDSEFSRTTADWTETARPLPRPPLEELQDEVTAKTIRENPDLFKIVTPINVDIFESYLSDHPNQPFVRSVCQGLREGFWPWADTLKEGYPATHDESQPTPSNPTRAVFLTSQLAIEQSKDRFSRSFGRDLLPGMYSMPIYAVPKPNSTDLRLVTDQSYGRYSLNSMIDHDRVTGYPLDNLKHLGEMLLDLERRSPGERRVVWKSDIAEAYRLIPMHPHFQIKQVNTIGGQRYIDRNNSFGGSGSGALFIAVNSCVAWIAKRVKGINYLGTYVDDSSGCSTKNDLVLYEPYGKLFPRPQATLLGLWDELGIPHKEKKQLWGESLPIIGIHVDANKLEFTLTKDSRMKLSEELRCWSTEKKREKLRKWFQMGGWFNWALNAYPLLRPALNNFYPKLSGRKDSALQVHINNAIREDFRWAADKLESSSGVLLLKSIHWGLSDATYVIYCDACPSGMGFWYPGLGIGFVSPTPTHENPLLIFYFEALCVLSALYDAHKRSPSGSRILIYTDNSNTVDIFNTLRALPDYNHLLLTAVDILHEGHHDVRVLHVPGVENGVADALSRLQLTRALELVPGLKISPFQPWSWTKVTGNKLSFQPPRGALGAIDL